MTSSTPRLSSRARLDGLIGVNVSSLQGVLGDDQVVLTGDGGLNGFIGRESSHDKLDSAIEALGVLDEPLILRIAVEGVEQGSTSMPTTWAPLRGEQTQVADRAKAEIQNL